MGMEKNSVRQKGETEGIWTGQKRNPNLSSLKKKKKKKKKTRRRRRRRRRKRR